MRIRDALIVAVGIIACIFAWLQDGSLSLQPSFVIRVHDADALLHITVQPIVADLDGDGVAEMLATPMRDKLALYTTGIARRNFEGVFVPLAATKSVQVGTDIVGVAAGYLTLPPTKHEQQQQQQQQPASGGEGDEHDGGGAASPTSHDGHPPRRTQHVAVVTDDYQLILFDATLTMQWSIQIVPPHAASIVLYHANVLVLPDRVFQNDVGMVVFSGKVSGPNGTEQLLYLAVDGGSGEVRWRQVWDDFAPGHMGAASPADGPVDGDDKEKATSTEPPKQPPKTADTKATSGSGDATTAAHLLDDAFLVTEGQLEARSNSRDWTFFRESLIAALPFAYNHPWDSTVQAHQFQHAKTRNKADRRGTAGGVGGHPSGIAETKYKARKVAYDNDDVGTLGEWFGLTRRKGKAAAAPGTAPAVGHKKHHHPNVLVVRSKHGIDALHLYTGKRIARIMPLRVGSTFHDLDDDFRIDEIRVQLGLRESSDGRRRVDLVHDCLGVITSGAPLARDAVYNATICDTAGILSGLKFISRFVSGDVAHEQPQQDPLELVGSRNMVSEKTRAVPPVVVQHHIAKGVGLFKLRRLGVFMVDSGLITCLDPVAKRVAWRVETDAGFEPPAGEESEVDVMMHSEEEKDNRLRRYPHLMPYSFHHRAATVHNRREVYIRTDPFVLAVGDRKIVAVSARDGAIAVSAKLPEPPIAPVLVVDLNSDGTNDVLVVTASSYYGFVVAQRGSVTTIPLLMMTMVGLLVMLFLVREVSGQSGEDELLPSSSMAHVSRPRKVKRSTD